MWGTLVVGALSTALSPVRLAVIVLLSSRRRPLTQLFAYWLGAMTVGTASLLLSLLAVHAAPVARSCARGSECGTNVQYLRITLGVLALLTAAVVLIRARRNRRMGRRSGGNDERSTAGDTANPVSRFLNRSTHPKGSARDRILTRARDSWARGSVWVAVVIGALIGGPSADGVVLGVAIITTSNANASTQIVAAVVLVVLMLSVVEVILVTAIFARGKLTAILVPLHDWSRNYRTVIVVVALVLLGGAWLAQGLVPW